MRAPSLDEHQNDLLTSLDLTDAEIERLRSDGAIR
jgi:hypothetical protein